MKFDWDPKKARLNVAKHDGVSFEEARQCFEDENALIVDDAVHEGRFNLVGYSTSRLLFVVYAELVGEVIRIISARKATSRERRQYEEGG